MDAHNLAIIFGPSLIRPSDNSVATMVTDMNDLCRVIESIILHVSLFFNSLFIYFTLNCNGGMYCPSSATYGPIIGDIAMILNKEYKYYKEL